jgi:hypothetical protein
MTTQMPNDGQGRPIPALRLSPGKAHTVTTTATAAKNSTAFDGDTRVISIYATEDVFVEVGTSTVVATALSHFIPAGLYYDIALVDDDVSKVRDTHISCIRSSSDGTVYISEKA